MRSSTTIAIASLLLASCGEQDADRVSSRHEPEAPITGSDASMPKEPRVDADAASPPGDTNDPVDTASPEQILPPDSVDASSPAPVESIVEPPALSSECSPPADDLEASDFRVTACGGGVVLPEDAAPDVFDQCSRAAPTPDGPYWTPTEATLGNLEARLPSLLSRMTRSLSYAVDEYCVQYAGFTFDERQYVYVNAAAVSQISPDEPLRACDGGDNFWGVVFDPAQSCFLDFVRNGAPRP